MYMWISTLYNVHIWKLDLLFLRKKADYEQNGKGRDENLQNISEVGSGERRNISEV